MKQIQTKAGLPEPVHSAQRIFKAALEAMSRPGRLVEVFDLPPAPPLLGCGLTALALALCDQDTPIWLDQACNDEETRHHLRFHCGCPLTEDPAKAAFAFIANPARLPRLHVFAPGLPEYPDRSCTLILRAGLGGSQGECFALRGPGVKAAEDDPAGHTLNIAGLPGWFRKDWQANHAWYPLGVDLLLLDDAPLAAPRPHFKLLGLPRSVSFEPLQQPQSFHNFKSEASLCMSR